MTRPQAHPRASGLAACWLLLLLAGCAPPPPPLPHEAYIWQRLWTPAVVAAVPAQAGSFAGWRVLALQVVGQRMLPAAPDLRVLATSGKPVRLVVRIEGARLPIAAPTLAAQLLPLLRDWRTAGIALAGVEIDHDCATAALGDYARWLTELRALLPPGLKLSITALPTWLASADLDALLALSDDSVLQVHAVQRPQAGLFDADQALDWARRYATRTDHPFALALPAYGVRVATDANGQVRAVDAEAEFDRGPAGATEMRADPQQIAALLATLRADPPAHLNTILWFRLPVAGDRRGVSASMLAALIAAAPLERQLRLQPRRNAQGSVDLLLRNRGNLDVAAPPLELPASCRFADGLGFYRLHQDARGLRLVPAATAWLPAGSQMVVGWARCAPELNSEWTVP